MLLKEKPNIPYPVQRLEWFTGMQSEVKKVYSLLKKRHEDKTLAGLEETADIIESVYQDLFLKLEIDGHEEIIEGITASLTYNLTYMHNWAVYKQSYRFDNDFLSLLMNETDAKSIPVKALVGSLPYPAFFIDNRFQDESGVKYRGVYISLLYSTPTKPELGMMFVEDTGESDYRFLMLPLYYEDDTVEELMNKRLQEYANKVSPRVKEERDTIIDLAEGIVNVILYLCSQDREVEVIKIATPQSSSTGNKSKKKQKPRTTKSTENKVGYKIGASIRASKKVYIHEESENKTHKKGSKKSPHVRRAHYHKYWTGSEKDGTKKIVVKLLMPIFVGKDDAATLHKVKAPK